MWFLSIIININVFVPIKEFCLLCLVVLEKARYKFLIIIIIII